MTSKHGYDPDFIGGQLKVGLPQIAHTKKEDLFHLTDGTDFLLHYPHHSVALSKSRRLPFFAAVNIDGGKFKQLNRSSLFNGGSDRWTLDKRAVGGQWGDELYSAPNSDFDKGHLVKREDPQWGDDEIIAAEAAKSTFFFANCAPQVGDLNRKEWRGLEDYILKKESSTFKLKVSVFTGPVLADDDPVFVHKIKGEDVQIPALFWKLVYYTADGIVLNRAAFLMGQKKMLLKRGIARPKEDELETFVPDIFSDYEDAAMFQVNPALIEELTGLKFAPANEPYKDNRAKKIVVKEVDLGELESFPGVEPELELEGIVL